MQKKLWFGKQQRYKSLRENLHSLFSLIIESHEQLTRQGKKKMSKFELQQRALDGSGVSLEESQVAVQLEPSLYERLGKEKGWKQLSTLFYDRVFADTEAPHFKSIFASSTKREAIENQVRACV
jgi:hypothetical protein